MAVQFTTISPENAMLEYSAKDIVAFVASFCTIVMFFSGCQICSQIWTRKSTVDITVMPFLTTFVSCSLWVNYGMVRRDTALIVVNAVGVALQISYTIFYYWMCANKKEIQKKVFIAIGVLLLTAAYIGIFANSREEIAKILGTMACGAVLVCLASPMAALKVVLRTKSTEVLPFFLIFAGFVMSALWSAYGVLISDIFVLLPNAAGMIITGFQMILFLIYPNKSTMKI